MRISDWSSDVCSSDLRASTLELGFRRGVPGVDPVALTGNLAYTRWRDIQADVTDRIGIPTTANIGDGRIYTVEGRVAIRPAPRLTLDGSIIYNRSEEHTSELQSLMRISYAVFCLTKKTALT